MRVLFLSFYFPPDLAAGSFRARALVDALEREFSARGDLSDSEIVVLTSQPNRYATFRVTSPELEREGHTVIRRCLVTAHQSGVLDQSKAYGKYVRAVMSWTRRERFDVVVGTSSRLMTAALSAVVAWRTESPLYLDIRDLFVDTAAGVFRGLKGRVIRSIFKPVERLTFRRAERINIVSEGFRDYVEKIVGPGKVSFHPNGIDSEFIELPKEPAIRGAGNKKTICYAGNIGAGQGLEKIIPEAADRLRDGWNFRIIGDGGARDALVREIESRELTNVELIDPVDRTQLAAFYRSSDVLFLHLNDLAAFDKVLPSKVFEYAASSKPVLAGVSGYAAHFIRNNIANAQVFAPCDVDGFLSGLKRLALEPTDRSEFCARYARAAIMDRMAKEIVSVAMTETAQAV